MAPWLQFLLASEGYKMLVPRTSYGTPKPAGQTQVPSPQGPAAGYQRPVAEGYRMPPSGKYRDPDAGIRGQVLPPAMEIPVFMMPNHLSS